ncbi:MAG: hypothetical protein ACOYOS_16295, partial [Syntrophales bacterium]
YKAYRLTAQLAKNGTLKYVTTMINICSRSGHTELGRWPKKVIISVDFPEITAIFEPGDVYVVPGDQGIAR